MSLKEKLGGLFRGNSKRKDSSAEGSRNVSVEFYDLRKEAVAKERGVEPGYYFTINPIFESELKNSNLITRFTLSFFDLLRERGLLETSGTQISIDSKAEMVVDPSQGWVFSSAGYIPNPKLLVVRANHVDRDRAQGILVKVIRQK